MPGYAATHLRSNLINILNTALNGDMSTSEVAGIVFNSTADTNAGQRGLAFNSPITASATLARAIGVASIRIPLESSHAAAPFRPGDVVHLVNTNGTATAAITVAQVNPTSQEVVLAAAPGVHPAGAVMIRPATTALGAAPGAQVSTACGGAPLDNMAMAEFLEAVENFCGNNPTNYTMFTNTGGVLCDASLQSNLVIDQVGAAAGTFVNVGSLVGAVCTFTATTQTAALQNQRATVTAAAITAGPTITLTLDTFESAPDADGVRTALTQWAATPAGGGIGVADQFDLDLDLTSHNKLTALGQAGGDMTTLVSSILTMHRKLDPTLAPPEIPVLWENQVWQKSGGTHLKLSELFVNNSTTVVVEMDEAVGDLPIPLSGRIRLLNLQDNVNSTGGSFPPGRIGDGGTGDGWVSYTRTKRSNILTCATTPDNSGVGNYPIGCRVELDPGINGLVVNQGFAPTVDPKDISGLLWELMEAVRLYISLEGA